MVVHSFIPQTFLICRAVFLVAFIGGYVGNHMRLVGTRAVAMNVGAQAGVYETINLRGRGTSRIHFKVGAGGVAWAAWPVGFFTFVSVGGTSNTG